MPPINIARTDEKHVSSLYACLDQIERELGPMAVPWTTTLEQLRLDIRRDISEGAPHFVALAGDRDVVGWCEISRGRVPAFRHAGILGIGVLAEHRRRRIGTKLIKACLHQARVLGLERVELQVFVSNPGAIALYESLGFVEEGRKRRTGKFGGSYHDSLIMAMLLPSQ